MESSVAFILVDAALICWDPGSSTIVYINMIQLQA